MVPTLLVGDFILVNKVHLRHPPAGGKQGKWWRSAARGAAT